MATAEQLQFALQNAQQAGDARAVQVLTQALQTGNFDRPSRSQQQSLQASEKLRALEARKAQAPPEEAGFFGTVGAGLGTGTVGILESVGLAAITPLEEQAELKARKKIKDFTAKLKPDLEGVDTSSPTFNVSSGLGSIAGTGIASITGGLLGGVPGAIAAGSVAGIGTQVGEASERAREYGATEEERNRAITDPRILLAGAIETIPYLKAISKFSQKTAGRLEKMLGGPKELKGLLDRARSAATTGGIEAVQELAQNTAQNLVEQGYNPNKELSEGAAESAGYGGATGAIFQLMIDVLPGKQRTADKRTQSDKMDDASDAEIEAALAEVEKDEGKEDTREQAVTIPAKDRDPLQAVFNAKNDKERKAAIDKLSDEQKELYESVTQAQAQYKTAQDKQAVDEAVKLGTNNAIKALTVEQQDMYYAQVAQQQDDSKMYEGEMSDAELDALMNESEANEQASPNARPSLTPKEDTFKTRPTGPIAGTVSKLKDKFYEIKDFFGKKPELNKRIGDVLTEQQFDQLTTDQQMDYVNGMLDYVPATREQVQEKEFTQAEIDKMLNVTTEARRARGDATPSKLDDVDRSLPPVGEQAQASLPVEQTGDKEVVTDEKKEPRPVTEQEATFQQKQVEGTETRRRQLERQGYQRIIPNSEANKITTDQDKAVVVGVTRLPDMISKNTGKVRDRKNKTETLEDFQANRAAFVYFANAARAVDGIIDAVADIVQADTRTERGAKKDTKTDFTPEQIAEREQFRNKKNAELALNWARENFDSGLNTFIEQQLKQQAAELKDPTSVAQVQVKPGTKEAKDRQKTLAEKRKAAKASYDKMREGILKRAKKRFPKAATKKDLENDMRKSGNYPAYFAPYQFDKKTERRVDDAVAIAMENDPSLSIEDAKKAIKQAEKDAAPTTVENQADPEAETGAQEEAKQKRIQEVRIQKLAKKKIKQGKSEEQATKEATQEVETTPDVSTATRRKLEEREELRNLGLLEDPFPRKVAGIKDPISAATDKAIKNNNIAQALESIARATKNKQIRKIARKLIPFSEGVTIRYAEIKNGKVVDKEIVALAKKLGEPVERVQGGMYDPNTNTIILVPQAKGEVNVNTVLHEMTHAATHVSLRTKKSSPAVQQLKNIFESIKKDIPAEFDTPNIFEFVAEAYGNPEFRTFLAGINVKPKNQNKLVSVLEAVYNAFMNVLRPLVGRPTVARVDPDSVVLLDVSGEVDTLISQILAPSGTSNDIGLFQFNTPAKLSKLQKGIMGATSVLPISEAERMKFAGQVENAFKTMSASTKTLFLGFSPVQALGDIAKRYDLKLAGSIYKLQELMEGQRGRLETAEKEIEAVSLQISKWWKTVNDATKEQYKQMVNDSTTLEVDPSRPRSYYKDQKTEKKDGIPSEDKQVVWDRLNAIYASDAVGDQGRMAYKNMRDAYKAQFKRLKEVILGDISRSSELKPNEKAKMVKDLEERMFNKITIDPYFPLYREGQYTLAYNLAPSVEPTRRRFQVEKFDSDVEMQARLQQLMDDGHILFDEKDGERTPKILSATADKKKLIEDLKGGTEGAPTSFVKNVLAQLAKAGVDSKVQMQVMELYIDALPESHYAKSLQKRQGVEGYIQDPIEVFNKKGYDLARQVVRLDYAAKIRDLRATIVQMSKQNKANVKGSTYAQIVNEATKRADYAISPKTDYQALSMGLNRFAFIYTIGFNVSSAVVNLSQIPLFVLPYLSGTYGGNNAFRAITTAYKTLAGSGTKRVIRMPNGNVEVKNTALGLENYFIPRVTDGKVVYDLRQDLEFDSKEQEELIKSLKPLVEEASARGQLNQSYLADELNLDQSGRSQNKITSYLPGGNKFTRYAAFMFHQVEQTNRQVTLTASYLLEVKNAKRVLAKQGNIDPKDVVLTKAQEQQLARNALYKTQETNGGAVTETGARFAQNDVMRVALMYKNYGIQMYYTMLKSAKAVGTNFFPGDDKASKDLRDEAFRQLSYTMASSFLLAGVHGMPMYGAIKMMMDLLYGDEEEDFDTRMRKHLGELAYKGPTTYFSGVNVADRVALSGLLVQLNKYNPDASLEEDIGFYLGGPALSVVKGIGRGVEDVANGNFVRGVEMFVPTAVRNQIRAMYRYPTEGVLTRRQDNILKEDLNFGELAAQFLGFQPYAIEKAQFTVAKFKGIQRATLKQRAKYLDKYNLLRRAGDSEGIAELFEEIQEWNKRVPVAGRITGSTLARSASGFDRTSSQMEFGVPVRKQWNQLLDQVNVAEDDD